MILGLAAGDLKSIRQQCQCSGIPMRQQPTPASVFTANSALRSFAAGAASPPPPTPPPAAKTSHGGLKDEDRIFTNLYRQGDPFLKVWRSVSKTISCLLSAWRCNCGSGVAEKGGYEQFTTRMLRSVNAGYTACTAHEAWGHETWPPLCKRHLE